MVASTCLQALPNYEQVAVLLDMPDVSLGEWLWNKNGEIVEYTPPGYTPPKWGGRAAIVA